MTTDRNRTGDWSREEWVGSNQGETTPRGARTARETGGPGEPMAATGPRWVKTQWVGDQGHGAPAPIDPDDMPEGESRLSGDRHNPGEGHWASGSTPETTEPRPSVAPPVRVPDRA